MNKKDIAPSDAYHLADSAAKQFADVGEPLTVHLAYPSFSDRTHNSAYLFLFNKCIGGLKHKLDLMPYQPGMGPLDSDCQHLLLGLGDYLNNIQLLTEAGFVKAGDLEAQHLKGQEIYAERNAETLEKKLFEFGKKG